jgi:hypothetical protein
MNAQGKKEDSGNPCDNSIAGDYHYQFLYFLRKKENDWESKFMYNCFSMNSFFIIDCCVATDFF